MSSAGVCGTCRHGEPGEFGMIVCLLGWEAHDGLLPVYDMKTKKRVPCHMGHGELAAPEATPDCRCGCVPDRWIPKQATKHSTARVD